MQALIRRARAEGAFAVVAARGDADFGSVAVKVNLLDGRARVFTPRAALEGERAWIEPLGEGTAAVEREADAYLARLRDRDPDLWIVEVEDRAGRSFIV